MSYFNTPLTPQQEQGFQDWMGMQRKTQNIYPTDNGQDYDFRGAYLNNANSSSNGHWADEYKKPNEPTFSNQSNYASPLVNSGQWVGQLFVPNSKPQQHPLLQVLDRLLNQK
jgi:hypothetical protein